MVRDRFLTGFQSADPSGCPSLRPRPLEQTPATCGRFAWNTPLLVMLQSGGVNFDRVVLLGPAADGASCDDGAEVPSLATSQVRLSAPGLATVTRVQILTRSDSGSPPPTPCTVSKEARRVTSQAG